MQLDNFDRPPHFKVIIIYGVSGCGKTTAGKLIERETKGDYVFIDADDYHSNENKEKMSSGIPLTDSDRESWLKILNAVLLQFSRKKVSLVLACSSLKESYRASLSQGLRPFWCYLNVTEAERRVSERSGSFFSPSIIGDQFETLEVPSYGLHVESSSDIQSVVKKILDYTNLDFHEVEGETLSSEPCLLGESPCWHVQEQSLYWVDILSNRLHVWRSLTGEQKFWTFEKMVCSVAVCRSGRLILALSDEVVLFNPVIGLESISHVCDLDTDLPGNRANDGKVDPWGRLWLGTMNEDERSFSGRLICIDASGKKTVVEEGLGIPNTLVWKNKEKFYFADSARSIMWEYPLDENMFPVVGEKREFYKPYIFDGAPDGSTIDVDGALWNAQWNHGRVRKICDQGGLQSELKVGAPLVTSCCFGGVDLNYLFVTTAKIGLSKESLKRYPSSGLVHVYENLSEGLEPDLFFD